MEREVMGVAAAETSIWRDASVGALTGTLPIGAQFRGRLLHDESWLRLSTGLGYVSVAEGSVFLEVDPCFGWMTAGEIIIAAMTTPSILGEDIASVVRDYLIANTALPRRPRAAVLTAPSSLVEISRLPQHTLGQNATCSVRYGRSPQHPVLIIKCFDARAADLDAARRESATLQHVRGHPSIVDVVHAAAQVDPDGCLDPTLSEFAIAMQPVSGPSLRQLRSLGMLTTAEVVFVASRLLRAVSYLHDTCLVVHADIAPQNVLIDLSNNSCGVRLIDFGGAAFIDDKGHVTQYVNAQHVGTPGFFSGLPQETHDARARDLFGVGATLAWLLLGDAKFSDTFRTTLTTWRGSLPAMDERLLELILTLTDPDPACRGTASDALLHSALLPLYRWSDGGHSLALHCQRMELGVLHLATIAPAIDTEIQRYNDVVRERRAIAAQQRKEQDVFATPRGDQSSESLTMPATTSAKTNNFSRSTSAAKPPTVVAVKHRQSAAVVTPTAKKAVPIPRTVQRVSLTPLPSSLQKPRSTLATVSVVHSRKLTSLHAPF